MPDTAKTKGSVKQKRAVIDRDIQNACNLEAIEKVIGPMRHSVQPRVEFNHKQEVRLICKCGATTNWHDALWKAKMALIDIHEDQKTRD